MIAGWRPAYEPGELTHNPEDETVVGNTVSIAGKAIASVYWIVGTTDIKVRHKKRLTAQERGRIEAAVERLKARLASAST